MFLTPVPYFSTPQLEKKGLVIVDLEMLVNAQKAYDKTLNDMNEELVKLKKAFGVSRTNKKVKKT